MTDNERPLVTIAIPTYNRADRFLPEALASASSQTYDNLEIFVADNASTDGTRECVAALGDARIRYHRQAANVGSPANMNFCIEQARGRYTVILPDDDLLDPDFVESCLKAFAAAPRIGLVRTGARVVNGHGDIVRDMPNQARDGSFGEFLEDWIAGVTAPYQCSTLFRSDALKHVGLRSRHFLFDDTIAHFRVSAEHGAGNVHEPKVTFRVHGGALTEKTPMHDWCEESLDLLDLMIELCPQKRRFLETKGMEFLAIANFRRALRRPRHRRLLECLTVLRMHRFTLPSRKFWLNAIRRRIGWA